MTARLYITRMRKAGSALLCKRITAGDDGKPVSDGSPCAMTNGTATRVEIVTGAAGLADLIAVLDPSEALVLGDHVAEADEIRITRAKNAAPARACYGRTLQTFRFRAGKPAVVLLDFDQKGMPDKVADLIDTLGGFETALSLLLPKLESYARVVRASTSAGIYNKETGEKFPASGGQHLYLFAQDGADVPRFLRDLQARAWLEGLGWIMVAARGAKLVRSIVDTSVGSPERLVFEGPPLVVAPLAQDREARRPIAHDGEPIDTGTACPPLTAEEERQFQSLVTEAKRVAEPEAEAAIEKAAGKLAQDCAIPIETARATIRASHEGRLLSWDEVHFDDDEIGVVSVADILADPEHYHGETLADPLEGRDYGKGKAKIYYNGGGDVRVHSFAHGGGQWELQHTADFIGLQLKAAGERAPEVFAGLIIFARDLNAVDWDRLKNLAAKVSGTSRNSVRELAKGAISVARRDEATRRAQRRHFEQRQQRQADDKDRVETQQERTTADLGDPFFEVNEAIDRVSRRFFLVAIGGSVLIGTYQKDDVTGREALYFVKPNDFKLLFANETYLVAISKEGREIWKDLGSAWIQSSRRRQYHGAGFYPRGDCPPGILDLWRGWGYPPKEGSWDTIAWHLLHIICSGNHRDFKYLVQLLAYWVQNPEKIGEVALVMRGHKGTGKGSLVDVLKRWFRHHVVHITQPRHLTGHFNAHLADCLLLYADEVVWGGDRQGEGPLKGLITERLIQIEPKGVNSFQMPNRIKLVMSSNSEWCVPVSGEERRFFVNDVSDVMLGQRDYFDQLHAAIDGGEAEAMLHELLQMDLADFSHRDVPHTVGLNAQKMEGLDSVGRWWASCLQEGCIVGIPSSHDPIIRETSTPEWPTTMRKRKLHEAYVRHAREHGESHPRAENIFPQLWRRYAPSIGESKPRGGARREWKFGTLVDHRAEFQRMMKIESWDWGDIDDVEADNVTSLRGGSRF